MLAEALMLGQTIDGSVDVILIISVVRILPPRRFSFASEPGRWCCGTRCISLSQPLA